VTERKNTALLKSFTDNSGLDMLLLAWQNKQQKILTLNLVSTDSK
jgi:hypothetical protein